jgi:5-methylcytosine-specific restriction endonuclease McrA
MTDTRTLVLNRAWQPVAICGVERAFGLLVSGAAHALDAEYQTYDFDSWSALSADRGDDIVHTVKYALKVPRILVLQAYDKLPHRQIRFSRQNVYARDAFTCQYCGKQFPRSKLNLDHVVPRCMGGRTSWTNVVCSCRVCNTKKGGRTPEQAGMNLVQKPRKPNWNTAFAKNGRKPYREWIPFLDPVDAAYWNVELEED